ncbi:integrase [Anaerotaenia torta]|uniref:site-specific integrase n=1 Tax=Anaerotaenia torta TaxID=433293 RepID=UPI003D1D0C45
MASKTPRKDKDGNITSYQIEVYRGRDPEGKKLKPYSMTWQIPEGWKSENKIKKELDRVAAQFEIDCKAGAVPLDKKTFKEYSDYVMELKERDKKHRTVHRYRQLLERINEEFGHMKLTDITGAHLNRFYMKLGKPGANKKTGEPLSPETILYHHRVIHMVFAQAVKEHIFMYNIADTATPPKVDKHEAEFFELEEVLAIRDALLQQPLKWQSITDLLIDTGARRGEVLGLHWEDVDFKNNKIDIHGNLQYTPDRGIYLEESTKTNEDRTVTIAPEIMRILAAHRKEQLQYKLQCGDYWIETGFCFTQDNGTAIHPDSLNKWLREFTKKYKLPHIHPHKFRHTQASLLYYSGEDPITISKRLGHKKVSTTQNIYGHRLKGADERASDKIASLLYRNNSSNLEAK